MRLFLAQRSTRPRTVYNLIKQCFLFTSLKNNSNIRKQVWLKYSNHVHCTSVQYREETIHIHSPSLYTLGARSTFNINQFLQMSSSKFLSHIGGAYVWPVPPCDGAHANPLSSPDHHVTILTVLLQFLMAFLQCISSFFLENQKIQQEDLDWCGISNFFCKVRQLGRLFLYQRESNLAISSSPVTKIMYRYCRRTAIREKKINF